MCDPLRIAPPHQDKHPDCASHNSHKSKLPQKGPAAPPSFPAICPYRKNARQKHCRVRPQHQNIIGRILSVKRPVYIESYPLFTKGSPISCTAHSFGRILCNSLKHLAVNILIQSKVIILKQHLLCLRNANL